MKIDEITIGLVNRALDLYHRVAFAGQEIDNSPDLGDDPELPITMFLHRFTKESADEGESEVHRYFLRLGNCRYPFMKFVIQEQIVQGEYFFFVDTHDEVFKEAAETDRDLARVRDFNRRVKEHIERLWAAAGIPTTAALKVLILDRKLVRKVKPRSEVVLVVDDDREIGDTIQLVLEADGFTVERVYDGEDAIDVADGGRHDLIIMDNEMEVMDGLEAARFLKGDPHRRHIPIIIATTRNLDMSRLEHADAFLKKPFHVDTLLSFVTHLLRARGGPAEGRWGDSPAERD